MPPEHRRASRSRQTAETDVRLSLDLDGTGEAAIATGVPFFDHMLTLFARHALIDLDLRVVPNPHLAVRAAVELLGPEDCLCATGSVYLAGIARNILLQNRAPGPAHRDERWEG